MTPRQRRMTLVLGIVAGVGIAGALALSAFRQNVTFFFDPTQVSQGQVKSGEHFRLGGMVTEGSVKRQPGSLEVRFVVTDFKHQVPVSYTGVLPDLFREGTGVVAHGHMSTNGTFVADEVLAKHDEKYMPPEVAKSLKRRHGEAREDALNGAPAGESGAGGEARAPGAVSTGGEGLPPSTTSTQAPQSGDATTARLGTLAPQAPGALNARIETSAPHTAATPTAQASAGQTGPASRPDTRSPTARSLTAQAAPSPGAQ